MHADGTSAPVRELPLKDNTMDEDEGKVIVHDEVDAQDVIDAWFKTYPEGMELLRWYFDSHRQTFVLVIDIEGPREEDG